MKPFKRMARFALRVVALALAITLAVTLFPYVGPWVTSLLGRVDYERSARVITHEMEKLGELTSLRMTDTGVMDSAIEALLVGTVASVRVEYRYEIGFGVDLSSASVKRGANGLVVSLPGARMLYDSFEVTKSPEIKDFFALVSEKRYQDMLTEQALACREAYTSDFGNARQAWDAACEALEALFQKWTDQGIAYTFEMISE